MWNIARSASHGGKSARRILTFALAAVVAALMWTFVAFSDISYAVDASWSGVSTITYNNNSYAGPVDEQIVQKMGLPQGSKVYTYSESSNSGSEQVKVIYFPTDEDAKNGTNASYETLSYNGSEYSSESSLPESITVDKQPDAGKNASSCVVDGVGWFVCPITRFLATGMDWIFKALTGFLEVKPVQTGQENTLHRAWSYMRGFANIAFVIAFLIIIYSQMTNFGISSYGIKKMLPRLIIAAILVNLSYFICSIAVDISNILGYSIQDTFTGIRDNLIGMTDNTTDVTPNWQSMTGFILSGGAATAGLAAVIITNGWMGSIFLLLPALVGCLLAVLTAFLILAGRQALITVLIVLAPLAFVCYLLPNTEKWFEKWKSTFMTMMILFPAFSVVFGGAQMASAVIIKNANSINTVILGMMVQAAPLFITPLLINLSGSMLGKLASLVDKPNSKIMDATRKYSGDLADTHKAKRLATNAPAHSVLRRAAQKVDHNRRKRETQRKIYSGMADNRFMDSDDNRKLYRQNYAVEQDKKYIESSLERGLQNHIRNDASMLRKEMKTRHMADLATEAKLNVDIIEQEIKAGKNTKKDPYLTDLANKSQQTALNVAIKGLTLESAKRVQQINFEDTLVENRIIEGQQAAVIAAGIEGDKGLQRIQAHAKALADKRDNEELAARIVLYDQSTTPEDKMDFATGKLNEALDTNDIFGALASVDQLLRTGANGKMKLHKILDAIESGDNRKIVSKIKNYLLVKNIKEADITLDKWAINEEYKTLEEVATNPDTFKGVTLNNFVSMTNQALKYAHQVGYLNVKTATDILNNPQLSSNLTPGHKAFYQAISDGKTGRDVPDPGANPNP